MEVKGQRWKVYGKSGIMFENQLIVLGVSESSIMEIGIYPNPTKDKLYIKGSFDQPLKVSVSDIAGKVILTTTIHLEESLDVSTLNSGMYMLNVDGTNKSFKFIKQ